MKSLPAALVCLLSAAAVQALSPAPPSLEASHVRQCAWTGDDNSLQQIGSEREWKTLAGDTTHGFASVDWSRDKLIVFSAGLRPTPGYTLQLASSAFDQGTGRWRLVVREDTPPADAMLPQVISHPCLILRVPGKGLREVQATDGNGKLLASVRLR